MFFFLRNGHTSFKIHMKFQGAQDRQNNLEKEDKVAELTILNLKIYYKATAIKIVWFWHKDRNVD